VPEPLVVLIYNRKGGYQTHLESQLRDAGIERHDIVLPFFSWRTQLEATLQAAYEFPDRLLMVIDAWDQVLLGTKKDLIECAQSALLGHVTLAGAKFCWPDDRQLDYYRKRGPAPSPWCYINNSPVAGLGKDVARAIEYGLHRHPIIGDSAAVNTENGEVPERFWTSLYLDGPESLHVRIDHQTPCSLNVAGSSTRLQALGRSSFT
jgi:hypothetical protein